MASGDTAFCCTAQGGRLAQPTHGASGRIGFRVPAGRAPLATRMRTITPGSTKALQQNTFESGVHAIQGLLGTSAHPRFQARIESRVLPSPASSRKSTGVLPYKIPSPNTRGFPIVSLLLFVRLAARFRLEAHPQSTAVPFAIYPPFQTNPGRFRTPNIGDPAHRFWVGSGTGALRL